MISGRRNKKHVTFNNATSEDEIEPMQYSNKKGKKKSRRAKKEKGKAFDAEATRASDVDDDVPVEETTGLNASDIANYGDDDQVDHDTQASSSTKAGKQSVGRKDKSASKSETEAIPKNSSKGRKQKEKSRNYVPVCEKCGEEFESRNQLQKHLSETGHASLKSR